jgi:hypothetical protein
MFASAKAQQAATQSSEIHRVICYDAATKSMNAPQALVDVQRDWVKLLKQRGLLDAVRLAGPFIMSSQGRQ